MWLGSVSLLPPEAMVIAAGVSAWQLLESFYDLFNKGGHMRIIEMLLDKRVWNLGGCKKHTSYIKGTI